MRSSSDRRTLYLLDLRELERLRADMLDGTAADLGPYLAQRVTVWTTVQDAEGHDVDVFTLHPSWTGTMPVPLRNVH